MTTLAPTSNSTATSSLAAYSNSGNSMAVTSSKSSSAAASSGNASTVTLGQSGDSAQTYSASGQLTSGRWQPIWENDRAVDTITSAMAVAVAGGSSLAAHVQGVGRALINSIANGGGDFSQSVLMSTQALPGNDGVNAILRQQLHGFASNSIAMSVTTVSGAKVEFTVSSNENGLAVSINTDGAKLTDVEREAMGDLADAFQNALDGLAKTPPSLALDGLMKFNSAALSSIDLNAKLGNGDQMVDFHVDSTTRTLSTSGTAGTMNVSVDLKNLSLLGSAQQQQKAIANYLTQFDAAQRRGKGDESLVDLFKQAFSQLNGNTDALSAAAAVQAPAIAPSSMDRKMLTGLLDFSASVNQSTQSPNPLKPGEVDSFSYKVSQQTTIGGKNLAGRSITQQQQSQLKAAYHESLVPSLPLKLGTDRQSQNYTYHQIDDAASSTMDIGYELGLLTRAKLTRSASQNTQVSKYVLGELVKETKTPLQSSSVQDFVAQLQKGSTSLNPQTLMESTRWQQMLESISQMVLLKDDPAELSSRKSQQ